MDKLHGIGLGGFAFGDSDQAVLAGGDAGLPAVNFQPAGDYEDAAFRFENILRGIRGNGGKAGGLLELRMRIEDGDETFHHHIIDLLLGLGELGGVAGWDDGKVIGDFIGVEYALGLMELRLIPTFSGEHRLGVLRNIQIAIADLLHGLADILHVVLGKVARIRPGIGEHLVLLIERLGDLERDLRGKRCLTLEGGEIVKLRRDLLAGFRLFGNLRGFPAATIDDGFRQFLVPDAVGTAMGLVLVLLEGRIDPFPEILPCRDVHRGVNFEIRFRDEGLDFLFACGEDSQRRRLDAACGGDIEAAVAGVKTGQCAGRVQADKPIGLGAALRGVGEWLHLLVGAEVRPSGYDRAGGHRLHPQAFDRLIDFPDLHDVAEN